MTGRLFSAVGGATLDVPLVVMPSGIPAPALVYQPVRCATETQGGRIVSAIDLANGYVATGAASGNGRGPVPMVDRFNTPYWRFEFDSAAALDEQLDVSNSFARATAAWNRDQTYVFVGRIHRHSFNNVNIHTPLNGAGAALNASELAVDAVTSQMMIPKHGPTNSRPVGADYAVGSQLQVIVLTCRPTASGGNYVVVDRGTGAALTQSAAQASGYTGWRIGGTNASFDLYYTAVIQSAVTNGQAEAIAQRMCDVFGIQTKTNVLVLDGDSIYQGVSSVTSSYNVNYPDRVVPTGKSLGMWAAEYLPADWRVINRGVSGATAATMWTRRTGNNAANRGSGRNVFCGTIGRNSITTTSSTGQTVYNNNGTLGTGACVRDHVDYYLANGWEVAWGVNVAVGSTLVPANDILRSNIRTNLIADSLAGSGQTFDGKLRIVDFPAFAVPGVGTIFDTAAQAGNLDWWQNDSTHPNPVGTRYKAECIVNCVLAAS